MPFLGRKLDDEVAYITGASSGIGAECAARLAACGAKVVLGARRVDRLEQVAHDIRNQSHSEVVVGQLDVNDAESTERWLADGAAAAGPPTILINNAGGAAGADRVADAKLTDWDWMIDTNVRAAFALTRAVLPGMIERQKGDIVMMASVAGLEGYIGGSVYCAAKAAVLAFAQALRKEVLGHPIRVMSFNPGLVETEFALVRFKGDTDKATKVYDGLTPLTPEDIADCVAFALTRPRHMCIDQMLILATDQSSATTVNRKS